VKKNLNVLGICLLLSSLLGCSATPPPKPAPKPKPKPVVRLPDEVLRVDSRKWSAPETPKGQTVLPYRDLIHILRNRQRWIDAAKRLHLQAGGTLRKLPKNAESHTLKPKQKPKQENY